MASEVSVVIPVRDGEHFVRACLENVLAQTRPPHEIIFVDDGSRDGTLALLRSLGEQDRRVNVLSQTPAGPAAARNSGIRAITGKYVAFLDVDDAWPFGMLEQACDCFEHHPQASVVAGLVQIRWTGSAPPEGSPLRKPHRRVNLGAHTFRADVFARFGLFDATLTYGEDIEYLSRLRQARVHIHHVDDVTLYYHQHGGNMTTGRGVHELGLFQALSRSLSRGRATAKKDP